MKRKECVVIGAGLAGLAAAYHLTQKRWNVRLLEATGRLGGRVMTHHFKRARVWFANLVESGSAKRFSGKDRRTK